MAKIIVEVEVNKGTAEDFKNMVEESREAFFPVGDNFLSVKKSILKDNPVDNAYCLFKLIGIIDSE